MATKNKTAKGKKAVAKSPKSAKPNSVKKVAKKKTAKPVKKAVVKKPVAKKPVAKKSDKPKVKVKKVAPSKVKATKPVAAKAVVKAPVKNVYVKPIAERPPVNRNNIATHSNDKSAKKTETPVQKPSASKPAVPQAPPVIVSVRPTRPSMPVPPPHKPVPAKPTATPVQRNSNGTEKTRYSDPELNEFKKLIVDKLSDARIELVNLNAAIISANENGTDDTSASFKMLEDGSDTLAKEEAAQLAARQKKFIEQLEAALIRIENKTYGVCRVTGKLIPMERLRAVPHTTQTMEAKLQQYKE